MLFRSIRQSIDAGIEKYFCVSTDKATNPVNMMGASKRIMEMFMMRRSEQINISTARFANVAFSDGSLLHGFNQRIEKLQPIVAPNDVERYFVTPQESGELCLMSCIFGNNRDIFFPKLSESLHLLKFSDIAINYLKAKGYEPYLCQNEEEARKKAKILPKEGKWPCLFSASNTTGEKDFEEFYTEKEIIDEKSFKSLGVIKNKLDYNQELLAMFEAKVSSMKAKKEWSKNQLLELFFKMIPDFDHNEKGKYLDSKM